VWWVAANAMGVNDGPPKMFRGGGAVAKIGRKAVLFLKKEPKNF
jgi:hypothetical protein